MFVPTLLCHRSGGGGASIPILCQITQCGSYKGSIPLMLTSFEVTTMDSQEGVLGIVVHKLLSNHPTIL